MFRSILKALNRLVNAAVVLALLISGAYAGYALWDNNQIYASASNVQADLMQFKPKASESGSDAPSYSFEQLLAINKDVRAWVTLDKTTIDYPVLQGEDNLSYINKDVFGNFALVGSIFMDTRCSATCEGEYTLLYGHHMVSGGMFGDLDLYKDPTFFAANDTGALIIPDKSYSLKVIACMLVGAADETVFLPQKWQDDVAGLLEYAQQNSLNKDDAEIETLLTASKSGEKLKLIALSTCASEFTNARTVVLAEMKETASTN